MRSHGKGTEVGSPVEPPPDTEIAEIKKARLICSARLVLASMGLLSLFNVSYVRIGISIAMVCMVVPTTGSKAGDDDHHTGEFNWSSATKGYLTSAAFYGFIAGPLVSGFLSFKFGGKLVLVLGSIISGITNFPIPETTRISPIFFFAFRVLTGFFSSFAFPAFYDITSHWIVPEERQLLVGGAMVGIPLASILNFPVNTLICQELNWPWIFYVLGIWTTACGFIIIFTVYNYPAMCPFISVTELNFLSKRIKSHPKAEIPWKKILRSLPIYAYIVMHFCMNYVYLSTILSLPLLMEDVYELSLNENGVLSATPYMGSLVIRILISLFFEPLQVKSKMSKNVMRKIFISVGAMLMSIFFVVVTFLSRPHRYWALGCFILATCSMELCITGGYLLSLLDLCPTYVNIISGVANSIGNTAGLICPVINGWITIDGTKAQWNIVFYVNVSVMLASVAFYLVFGQNQLQYWDSGSEVYRPQVARHSIVN